jgi:hypothetical protein
MREDILKPQLARPLENDGVVFGTVELRDAHHLEGFSEKGGHCTQAFLKVLLFLAICRKVLGVSCGDALMYS